MLIPYYLALPDAPVELEAMTALPCHKLEGRAFFVLLARRPGSFAILDWIADLSRQRLPEIQTRPAREIRFTRRAVRRARP